MHLCLREAVVIATHKIFPFNFSSKETLMKTVTSEMNIQNYQIQFRASSIRRGSFVFY